MTLLLFDQLDQPVDRGSHELRILGVRVQGHVVDRRGEACLQLREEDAVSRGVAKGSALDRVAAGSPERYEERGTTARAAKAVCDLLGGRTGVPMPRISSIHAGPPEDMRARVADHRRRGYRSHSIKIGAAENEGEDEGGPALDAARITACLADRQPGEWFMADANGGLTVESALRFLNLLPPGSDIVLEAPCATWRETLSLRRRVAVPIFWDELFDSEASLASIIGQDGADGIGLKISKQGGLTRCRRQRDIAIAAGLVMSVQETTGSDIAFAAICHMGQSVPPRWLRSVLDCRDMVSVTTARFGPPLRDGGYLAPDLPGLGIEPDLAVLGDPVARYG